jgi:rod shape determining protein RodA
VKRLYLRGTFDLSIFIPVLALWIIGNFLVYSATVMHKSGPLHNIYMDQILWTSLGILIVLGTLSIPTRIYYRLAPPIYVVTLIMLVMVLVGGESSKGAQRWINIGIRVQPSEFAKIGLLLMMARYFSKRGISLYKPKTLIAPALIIAVPFILVLRQPDLGTALVFMAMSVPIFFWAGMTLLEVFYLISPGISVVLSAIPLILSFGTELNLGVLGALPWALFFISLLFVFYFARPPKVLFVILLVANIAAAFMTNVLWDGFLKEYQKKRVISFVNPQADPRGAGYQVIQSMIAIGSGQSFGKGYLKGSQVNLSYLPEQHTDFIFSVLGEQFGFMGCIVVLMLFLFIVFRAFASTNVIRNRFSNLLLVGAASMISFHTLANIAMVIGMMPVTGLPLPLLSYGGSFTLTISILIGLMLNARADERNI